ncbi:hypothetical protein [Actinokineospora pegani]|uniref:hypothetical protein n=1 Tax=Actinokineospora pegani TaxID=2654637 RepID=UPI0012E9DDA3|nr:hypothetical protein [Actinokineospora pegani]
MTAIPDPASRYKAFLGLAHEAAEGFREEEAARAAKLGSRIHEAGRAAESARKSEKAVTEEINDWWREVHGRMNKAKWSGPSPRPVADPEADPDALDDYLADIMPATAAFDSALRKAIWPRKVQ